MAEVHTETLKEDAQHRGMLVDFAELKKDLKEEVEGFDHAFVVEEGSLKEATLSALREEGFRLLVLPFRPTAENLAKYFYERLKKRNYDVSSVKVYETPKNCAAYRE